MIQDPQSAGGPFEEVINLFSDVPKLRDRNAATMENIKNKDFIAKLEKTVLEPKKV